MPGRDIVVIGASAGGVQALMNVVRGLPAGLPAAVFVVLHIPPDSTSQLPVLLERAGQLPAAHAVDGEAIEHGRIYVAPPNLHLLVDQGRVRLMAGLRVNRLRPAADPLFRSAARAFGPRVVGVVLSGTLDDGGAGLATIKSRGGVAIVQDPEDAQFTGMPTSALERTVADYCVAAAAVGPLVAQLAYEPVKNGEVDLDMAGAELEPEPEAPVTEPANLRRGKRPGQATGITCPECHGSLWELADGDTVRFECRVNHSYSIPSLVADQGKMVEAAVWSAVNVLEERCALLRRLAGRTETANRAEALRLLEQADEADEHANVIHQVLLGAVRAQGVAQH